MTEHELLFQRYLKLFYKLTFDIEDEFKDIYDYEKRLIKYMSSYQTKVKKLRRSFLSEYIKNVEFRKVYHDYMNDQFDFILFTNLNISNYDQRKFSKDWYKKNINSEPDSSPLVRFIAYWYQVLLWEIFQHGISFGYWKSRDMGASFTFTTGSAMNLVHERGVESMFLARVESDVDSSKDTLHTNMGRTRGTIDRTAIYSRDKFTKDKFLWFYSNETTGILGGASSGDAPRQKRVKNILVDEAGIQKKLGEVKAAGSMTVENMAFIGTLKNGYDMEFRKILNAGEMLDSSKLKHLFSLFKNKFLEILKKDGYKKAYSKAWDFSLIDNLKNVLPVGKSLSFTNTFVDHPLKTGNCNYEEMEVNRLFGDITRLNDELYGKLHAGNPNRSFWGLQDGNFRDNLTKKFNFKDVRVFGGFDPGGSGKAYITPVVQVGESLYVLPTERFEKMDMFNWAREIYRKFPTMDIIGESSMNAFKSVGGGWYHVFKKAGFENIVSVTNRAPETQLMVFNYVSKQKVMNMETYNQDFKVLIDRKNEEWAMNYIQGGKYGKDQKQKDYSHPADALISVFFHLFQYLLEDQNRNKVLIG